MKDQVDVDNALYRGLDNGTGDKISEWLRATPTTHPVVMLKNTVWLRVNNPVVSLWDNNVINI